MGDFAKWKTKYETNIDFVDQQHKPCWDNEQASCQSDGLQRRRRASFRIAQRKSVNYVGEHFASEEKWMLETGYPEYERQKGEHQKFISS